MDVVSAPPNAGTNSHTVCPIPDHRVGVSHFAPWGYCSSFSKEEHPLSYRLHQTTSSPSGDARPTIAKFGLHESWR